MPTRQVANQDGWTLRRVPAAAPRKRRGGAVQPAIPPAFLQSPAVRVDEVLDATPSPAAAARRGAPPDLVLDVDLEPGEASVIAIRHPSGALTFHSSAERVSAPGRRRRAAAPSARFRIPVRRVVDE